MSIFSNPSKILEHFKSWFDDKSQEVLTFIKPTIAMFERDGRHALIAAATAAVASVATTDLSSADKRDTALKAIEASMEAAGLTFLESEGRVGLEMALQALKAAA